MEVGYVFALDPRLQTFDQIPQLHMLHSWECFPANNAPVENIKSTQGDMLQRDRTAPSWMHIRTHHRFLPNFYLTANVNKASFAVLDFGSSIPLYYDFYRAIVLYSALSKWTVGIKCKKSHISAAFIPLGFGSFWHYTLPVTQSIWYKTLIQLFRNPRFT